MGEFQNWAATGFGRNSQLVLGIELQSVVLGKLFVVYCIEFGGAGYRIQGLTG